MSTDYAGSILLLLRQIIRAIDKHNKQLSRTTGLTVPQVVCLRQLLIEGPRPISALADEVCLSKATLTGIVDRLEAKGLVRRKRDTKDRRKVFLKLTPEGMRMAREMPWPLQERFGHSLATLDVEEIEQMGGTLKRLLDMMEAPDMEVWPYGAEDAVPSDAEILQPELPDAIAGKDMEDGTGENQD